MKAASRFASLHALFDESVRAWHLMEALLCIPANATHAEAHARMDRDHLDVVGVERDGAAVGWWARATDAWTPFAAADLMADSASLKDALTVLETRERFFVLARNRVVGIVTRADLQKPPFHLYCFGVVALLEMRLLELIRDAYAPDAWQARLTPGRVDACRRVFDERRMRSEETELLDCLQLADKRDLIAAHDQLRARLGFDSKRAVERVLDEAEKLRNLLAHGHNLDNGRSWLEVIGVVRSVERLLT